MKPVPLQGTDEPLSGTAPRLLKVLIDEPDARQMLLPVLRDEDLEGCEVERIWRVVRDLARSGTEITYPRIGSLLPDPGDQALLLKMAAIPGPPASLAEGEECLRRLREKRLARRMQELQERLEKADPGSPVDDLIRQKMDLRKEMRALRSTPVQ